MTAFPQYAKTTDPAVLEAVRHNIEGRADFHRRACEFSLAQGVEKGAYYPSSFGGGHSIAALGGVTRPTTGRWKEGYRAGWLPFKNNPLAAELEAIRWKDVDVPGLPRLVEGPRRSDFSHMVATPQPFELDGTVYVGFSFPPVDAEGRNAASPDAGGWDEIKASEYHAAVETYNDRIQATDVGAPE